MPDRYKWELTADNKQLIIDTVRDNRPVIEVLERPMLNLATHDYTPSRIARTLVVVMNQGLFTDGLDTDVFLRPKERDAL